MNKYYLSIPKKQPNQNSVKQENEIKVLVVDDSPYNLYVLEELLK